MEGGENPVKAVRELLGLTQKKAAAKIGCHYQTIYFAEHGMFIPLPPRLVTWVVAEGHLSEGQVYAQYGHFQREKRRAAAERHSLGLLRVDCLGVPGEHPILRLRGFLNLNQSRFCKELCIPVAWLYEAETNALTLPPRLRSVLEDVGIPPLVLSEMAERYEILDA